MSEGHQDCVTRAHFTENYQEHKSCYEGVYIDLMLFKVHMKGLEALVIDL